MKYSLMLLAFNALTFKTSGQIYSAQDTSFTVNSAFMKAVKTHTGITIVKPMLPENVKAHYHIPYCHRAGHELELDIFYTAGGNYKSRPGVLLVHGGGWRSGNRSQQEPMAIALAAAGYVAVDAEYRLSEEAPYPGALYDLKAAVRWMRANAALYQTDTGKIAVLGCSAGGQLAALIGTTNGDAHYEDQACNIGFSSDVQAIVDVDGILAFIHPESGEGNERKGPSAATLWLGGTKEKFMERWQEASPLNHISAATPPVLFLNSSIGRMHAGRDDAIRKLDSLRFYSEVHTFKNAPHTFWLFNPWYAPMMRYIISFLNKIFHKQF